MKILVFHGYMLRGTGSNIYNANLARALARLGHEVHLLCQDREVQLEGVQIHNPDIGGLLPVYVKDPYEGFEVKAFPELTEEELDRYIGANVEAVREAPPRPAASTRPRQPPDHGPGDPRSRRRRSLRRQGPRLRPRVHGQAQPRFLPTPARAWKPPQASWSAPATRPSPSGRRFRTFPAYERRPASAPRAVDTDEFRPEGPTRDTCGRPLGPSVVFVGKLIVSKGVDLLLAAWPLVRRAPKARLQIAGFGEYEERLRRLLGGARTRRSR